MHSPDLPRKSLLSLAAYPRLHLGLLDLGKSTPRKYGGIGLAIDDLPLVLKVEEAESFSLIGFDRLDRAAVEDVKRATMRLLEVIDPPKARIILEAAPMQHIGLGSKTSLILAVLEATRLAGGNRLPHSDIQRLSGRGGTSGVGVHVFFRGGLIVDGGHLSKGQRDYRPSSATRPSRLPPVLIAEPVPQTWAFSLILPEGIRLAGNSELRFFADNTPIPDREVDRAMSIAYHGLAASVIEDDLHTFRESLAEFHTTGFKRRELMAQTEGTKNLFHQLEEETSAAVGMSSLGPLIYTACTASDERTLQDVQVRAARNGASMLGVFPARNTGYEVHPKW
jgi:beta-ribofuranosylaminobenzene 5'-phosphate synthase